MPLKIYRRGKVWHYRGTVAGRRLRGSTGAADKDIAARVAGEVERRHWKGHLDGPEAVLTFAQAAMLYRAAGKSTRFLEKVEDHWKDTLVKHITAGAIRQAAIDLYPSASAATRNRQGIVPTVAIINHAADSELCPHIKVKRFKTDSKIKVPATLEWVEAFADKAAPHIAAMAWFMFLTGARISEAIRLRWDDVSLNGMTALIRQTKTRKERIAHLPRRLVVALANLPRDNSVPVFGYENRGGGTFEAWRRVCKRAGIKYLSFHSCRHGFATALLRAGVDPVTVAKLGGWASVKLVLDTYGHAIEDRTLTDKIFGTPLTQAKSAIAGKPMKIGKSRNR
jgi:integrase